MADRREYMREYARKRRAADPVAAKEASRKAYAALKARECADPSLQALREFKQHEWRMAHRSELAMAARKRYDKIRSTDDGLAELRAQTRAGMARYMGNPRNKAKVRARWRSSRALRDGRLVRLPCEVCGEPKSEMHHTDYRRALDVRWLCRTHHVAAHKAPKPTRPDLPASSEL